MIGEDYGRRAAACLVAGCLLFAVSMPVRAEAPGAESPQALVERMKRAAENEDLGEMMACLAPEGRVQMVSMMYMMATMMVGFSMMSVEMGTEMGGAMAEGMAEGMGGELTDEQKAEMEAQKEKAKAEANKLRDSYNAMVSKYGLPELSEDTEMPDEDLEGTFREIDQAAFLQDVMAFLESMPGDEDSADEGGSPWDVGEGTLTDLVIEGDTASGKVDGEDVTFVRIDDRWYFDEEIFGGAGGPGAAGTEDGSD